MLSSDSAIGSLSARGGRRRPLRSALARRSLSRAIANGLTPEIDIKLANIMFSEVGSIDGVKLIDFGVSSRCQAGALLTGRSGTTAFMAPEQIRQVRVRRWIDVSLTSSTVPRNTGPRSTCGVSASYCTSCCSDSARGMDGCAGVVVRAELRSETGTTA